MFGKFTMSSYKLNPFTGKYEKLPQMIPFNKLPYILKVEQSQKDFLKNQGANIVLTGNIKHGNREFFSGLIPIQKNWYEGNHYEFIKGSKVLSLIIFHFREEDTILDVYFFNHFYKHNRDERRKYGINFINFITSK